MIALMAARFSSKTRKSLGAGGRGSVFPVLFDSAHDATGRKIDLACKVLAEGYRSEGAPSQGGGACPHEESRGDLRCVAGVVDLRRGSVGGFTMYRLAGSSLDAVVADPATGSRSASIWPCVRAISWRACIGLAW